MMGGRATEWTYYGEKRKEQGNAIHPRLAPAKRPASQKTNDTGRLPKQPRITAEQLSGGEVSSPLKRKRVNRIEDSDDD